MDPDSAMKIDALKACDSLASLVNSILILSVGTTPSPDSVSIYSQCSFVVQSGGGKGWWIGCRRPIKQSFTFRIAIFDAVQNIGLMASTRASVDISEGPGVPSGAWVLASRFCHIMLNTLEIVQSFAVASSSGWLSCQS